MRQLAISVTITSIVEVADESKTVGEIRAEVLGTIYEALDQEDNCESIAQVLAGAINGAEETANSCEISINEVKPVE